MKRRIRSLLVLLLTLAIVSAESGVTMAGELASDGEPGIESSFDDEQRAGLASKVSEDAVTEPGNMSTGRGSLPSGYGGTTIGEYTVVGNILEYGYAYSSLSGYRHPKNTNPFTVFDNAGNEVDNYLLNIDTVIFNGKEYSDLYKAYNDGLEIGDTVDLRVTLTIRDYSNSGQLNTESSYSGRIDNVSIVTNRIVPDKLHIGNLYRGRGLKRSLDKNRLYIYISNLYMGNAYMRLTDSGLSKVGDFSSDSYELQYGQDFSIFVEKFDSKDMEYKDISDHFAFDLDGYTPVINIENSFEFYFDILEIQAGISPDEFMAILRKHVFLFKNSIKQDIDSSSISIKIYESGSAKIVSDYQIIADMLKKEGDFISVEVATSVNDNGKIREVKEDHYFRIFKNSFNLYLEPFEEVASATGASYSRTEHDFMVNLYAVKNETEKIRVGSLGDNEVFKLYPFDDDRRLSKIDSINSFFSGIRPDYEMIYSLRWKIPDEDDSEYGNRSHYFGEYDNTLPKDPLRFFAYEGTDEESSKTDLAADPFSDLHNTDGSNEGALKADSPSYVFDPVKSNTLIGAVKVDVSKKFEGHVSANGYNASAKHRYTVDNKKLAKIDKKGNITPKKSGTIKISLEQKVKGSGWTKIGDPVTMYIQVPEIKKSESSSAGQTIDGRSLVQKTTYAPVQWESSNPSVADVDAKTGKITVHKKGKTKIYAVYGVDSGSVKSSKKKYRVKLKVS